MIISQRFAELFVRGISFRYCFDYLICDLDTAPVLGISFRYDMGQPVTAFEFCASSRRSPFEVDGAQVAPVHGVLYYKALRIITGPRVFHELFER